VRTGSRGLPGLVGLIGALAAALVVTPAGAQDRGLRLVGVEQLPEAGHARIRAEVLDPAIDKRLGATPSGSELRVELDDGEASVVGVQRVRDLGLRTHTIVAVDHSGSFKQWGHADPAWAFVEAVGGAIAPGDTVSLTLFSETTQAFPVRASSAELQTDLDAARATDWGVITRLHNALLQAVDGAATANPGGLNRIYVLTDGDEESNTWSWKDVAKAATARGVQVHVLIYPPDLKKVSAQARATLPTRLDDLRALAGATGGAAFEHDAAQPDATLAIATTWEQRGRDALAVQASLCGLSRDTADNVAHLEFVPSGGAREAWTDGFAFTEWGSDALFAACPGAKVADASTPAPPPADPKPATPWWVWALVATLAVLLLLALVLGMRRERTEVVVKADPPPAPPPVPVAAPTPEPPVAAPPAAPAEPKSAESPLPWDLPRTFLEVTGGGQWLKDPRYAIYKRELQIGGDAARGVDLHVDQPGVSGLHCTVQLFPRGDVWVRDEGSSNGTFVDGERIPKGGKRKLELGGELRLGSEIRFRLARPDAPVASSSPSTAPAADAPPDVSPAEPRKRRTPKKTRILE